MNVWPKINIHFGLSFTQSYRCSIVSVFWSELEIFWSRAGILLMSNGFTYILVNLDVICRHTYVLAVVSETYSVPFGLGKVLRWILSVIFKGKTSFYISCWKSAWLVSWHVLMAVYLFLLVFFLTELKATAKSKKTNHVQFFVCIVFC